MSCFEIEVKNYFSITITDNMMCKVVNKKFYIQGLDNTYAFKSKKEFKELLIIFS